MKPRRQAAIDEARDLFEYHVEIVDEQTFTRDEADEQVGTNWTHLIHIEPHDGARIANVNSAIETLRNVGYRISVRWRKGCVVRVRTSADVWERHEA